ncbi:MAG TPA: sugar fermentation stimulation protein SfsA, partial [Enterococcus sp.]|nr:sugar fermentation stimulation protein SfsA [Enterococcus sp.]
MNYPNTLLATFLVRDNRFIARCLVDDQEVIVHVKNTGRGKELLHKGALVT